MADERLDKPKWLDYKYNTRGWTLDDIADECGVAKTTVWRRFKKYGISTSVDKRLNDKKWLAEKYIEDGMSLNNIANKCECGITTVRRRLIEHDIPIRGSGTGGHNADLDGASSITDTIIGEILGDGSLIMAQNCVNARFSYGVKHEEHRDWLMNILRSAGVDVTSHGTTERSARHGHGATTEYYFHTRTYPFLTKQYSRWYPEGEKRVPVDVKLTPRAVLHWYIGDGGYSIRDGNAYLHTQSFTEDGVRRLIDGLGDLGVDATMRFDQGEYPQIFIPKRATEDLFDLVPICPPPLKDVYGHKWPAAPGED